MTTKFKNDIFEKTYDPVKDTETVRVGKNNE